MMKVQLNKGILPVLIVIGVLIGTFAATRMSVGSQPSQQEIVAGDGIIGPGTRGGGGTGSRT
jgi:hypothetical protein